MFHTIVGFGGNDFVAKDPLKISFLEKYVVNGGIAVVKHLSGRVGVWYRKRSTATLRSLKAPNLFLLHSVTLVDLTKPLPANPACFHSGLGIRLQCHRTPSWELRYGVRLPAASGLLFSPGPGP